jgi:hypothetical protein
MAEESGVVFFRRKASARSFADAQDDRVVVILRPDSWPKNLGLFFREEKQVRDPSLALRMTSKPDSSLRSE